MAATLADALKPKSDQLNADDLIAGPITVTITSVTISAGEQPIVVGITGYKPWKPCKTMGRLLVIAWGDDENVWVGRSLTLYRDASVEWGGTEAGGIRVSHLSNIERGFTATLTAKRGKKAQWHVAKLAPPAAPPQKPVDPVRAAGVDAMRRGWTQQQVVAAFGFSTAAEVTADRRDAVIAALAGPPPTSLSSTDPDGF